MGQPSERRTDFDVVLVGGGLASALCVLALLERRPGVRIALVERECTLGGNHTWCFHGADVPARAKALVAPLVAQRWEGYSVRFPGRVRRLGSPYARISSERLHDVVSARLRDAPGCALLLGRHAHTLEAERVVLDDGRALHAKLVVDARGPRAEVSARVDAARGYQKFVGLELSVAPHELTEPVLFDACVTQRDGFRFMYVLPLSRERVLVEETFFSERPELDHAESTRSILAYAATEGLVTRAVSRLEHGVLPMPWSEPPFDCDARPLAAGYRAGLFHPVTGYSFPQAVRFALALSDSELSARTPTGRDSKLAEFAQAHAAQRPFLHLLTRLMFTAFEPDQRFRVLEHFYRLPEAVIERFYAAELTPLDRARVFVGAPPRGFSVRRALGFQAGAAP